MKNKIIIGFCGWKGSGKDTASRYISKKYGYKRLSFAEPLKDSISSIFLWNRKLLEGDTKKSRQFRDKVDEWWSKKLEIPNFNPVKAMQLIGTEAIRNCFNENIWVYSLRRKIDLIKKNKIVISDCRFTNEMDMIKNLGGYIIWIHRGNIPEWYYKILERKKEKMPYNDILEENDIHISESQWIGYRNKDFILINDSSKKKLYNKIDEIIEKIEKV